MSHANDAHPFPAPGAASPGEAGGPETAEPIDMLAALRDPATARLRCAAVARAVERGDSGWFTLDRDRLPEAAERVAETLRRSPQAGGIPPHGVWRHFEAGGVDRAAELEAKLAGLPAEERVRSRIDLAVVSALLGASAGPDWRYVEAQGPGRLALTSHQASRDELLALLDQAASGAPRPAVTVEPEAPGAPAPATAGAEGLAIASFRAFMAGAFSADPSQPCRVDASVLCTVDTAALRAVFQVGGSHMLAGLAERAALLARLGQALQAAHTQDGLPARPSALIERLCGPGFTTQTLDARALLYGIQRGLAPIWPSGRRLCGQAADDVWPHRWAGMACGGGGADAVTARWVPLHTPGQWLACSLLEPLQAAGVQVTHAEVLTGLADAAHGGLMLDCGVIAPRQPADLQRTWQVGDEFVIEWRALTLSLLDDLAAAVRERLGMDEAGLPMPALMAGGTVPTATALAAEKRGGAPAVRVAGDGVVFF